MFVTHIWFQDSDYDVDSDAESVCSTTSSHSLQVAPQPSFKVFVSYPPFIKREELKDHLRFCGLAGNVKRLNMFYDKAKKSKGCGYIEFVPPNVGRGAVNTLKTTLLLGKHKMDAKKYSGRMRKNSPHHRARKPSKRRETSPPVEEGGNERIKVFVGAGVGRTLPDSITVADLQHHLRAFKSAIQEVVIATDPRTDQSKGYGFVFFSSRRAAEGAIEKISGTSLHGCKLSLELSRPREGETREIAAPKESNGGTKVFVGAMVDGKLPSSIQSVHLRAFFWKFEHTLQEAIIVTDPVTKQSKGYGFAIFKTKRAAEAAIRMLGGSVLHGCQMKLDIAKTKEDYSHSRSSSQSSVETGYSSKKQEAATNQQSETSGNRVHVRPLAGGRLPGTIQSVHLRAHFWEFEHTLEEAFVVMDQATKQSKGFGFAVFKSKRAAEAAIRKLNGTSLHECQLKLEMAKPKADGDHSAASQISSVGAGKSAAGSYQPLKGGIPKDPIPSTTLKQSTEYKVFVGGLRQSVQNKHLQEHFSAFSSDIVNVYLYIPGGNHPKKCGFVVFSSYEAAEKAVSTLNGTKLHSGAIRVQHDKHAPKPPTTSSTDASVPLQLPVQPAPTPSMPSVRPVQPVPTPSVPSVRPVQPVPTPSVPSVRPVQPTPTPSVPSIGVPVQPAPPTPSVPSILDTSVPMQPPPAIPLVPSILDTGVPMQPAPLVPLVPQASNTVVWLSNLNPEIDEDTIKALCKGTVTNLRFIPVDSASKKAVITFSCADDARAAVGDFNGKVFLGQEVKASLEQGLATEHPKTEPEVGNLIFPLETPPSNEELIQLESGEWNLLTTVNPTGSSLYQELTLPFKANPNVRIELLPVKVAVRLTGQKDAVESAHSHFKSQLQRHIPIKL